MPLNNRKAEVLNPVNRKRNDKNMVFKEENRGK